MTPKDVPIIATWFRFARRFAIIVCALFSSVNWLGLGSCQRMPDGSEEFAKARGRLLASGSPIEWTESMADLRRAAVVCGIDLVHDADVTIALSEQWNSLRRTYGISAYNDNPAACTRLGQAFTERIQSELHCTPPVWWSEAIARTAAIGQDSIPTEVRPSGSDSRIGISDDGNVTCNCHGKAVYLGKFLELDMDIECACALEGDRVFLATYSPFGASMLDVECLQPPVKEGASWSRLWRARTWGVGRRVTLGLQNWHHVEILVSDGRLFVFGAEGSGAYMEVFDKSSGSVIARFCTHYLE